MRPTSGGSSFINTLASLTPSLVQIIAFLAIEFTNVFNIEKILINANHLTIVNFIVILVSLCFIGLYTYWRANYFQLSFKSVLPTQNSEGSNIPDRSQIESQVLFKDNKSIFKTLNVCIVCAAGSILLLLAIITFKNTVPQDWLIWCAFIQWISYVTFLTSLTLIIYIWLEDFQRRKNFDDDREKFLSLVLEKLREAGWLANTKVHLMLQNQNNKVILFETNQKFHEVTTSFDGKEIIKVIEYNANPLTPPQNIQK
jgi:hypothetical protein